ncbi:WbqC family protein [Ruegeria arenilitoris]|uniref:WbqC family protein n=1 Tax=Ruegeria arenilitoris TaxID=1173585 RepID=UPI00147C6B8C|nr:WbqC family protein [Ruegeria arenilitoris]
MNNDVLAVMQPYVFPYIGYFNLMKCASHFVLYDDVNFIMRGWVNRNRILSNGNPVTFSIPLSKSSQNSIINEVNVANLDNFKRKFGRTLEHSYAKAKYYDVGMEYVDRVLGSKKGTISGMAKLSITCAADMLGIDCKIHESSKDFSDTKGMERSERLICIAKRLKCNSYVNAAGGSSLYDKGHFKEHGIELKFINPNFVRYKQVGSKEFVPALSVIDLIMNQSIDEIRSHLKSYELT